MKCKQKYALHSVGKSQKRSYGNVTASLSTTNNKKLSYPQRKCASNVAILYGADGIFNMKPYKHGITSVTGLVSGAICRINTKTPNSTQQFHVDVDSFGPVFNTLVRVNP